MKKQFLILVPLFASILALHPLNALPTPLSVTTAGDGNPGGGGNAGDFRSTLNFINQNPGDDAITFDSISPNTISLGGILPLNNLNAANIVTIDGTNDGNEIVIDERGTPTYPGLYLKAGVGAINGAAAGNDIFVTSNTSIPLTFNLPAAQTVTINPSISDDSVYSLPGGSGLYTEGSEAGAQLVKSGDGTLDLNHANTYTGSLNFIGNGSTFTGMTLVQNKLFSLNSTLGSHVVVESGSTFAGVGTVGGNLHISSGATIAPGNGAGIGTLSVLGNYQQDSGSTYFVQLNNQGQSSQIIADGTAVLNGGQVLADVLSLPFSKTPYLILTANGGVTGQYSGLSFVNLPTNAEPTLLYDPNHVYIFLLRTGAFVFPAATCNQQSVAAQLESVTNPTPALLQLLQAIYYAPSILAPTDAALQAGLNQISGEQYTTLFSSAELTSHQFMRRLYDPLRSIVTTARCRTVNKYYNFFFWDCPSFDFFGWDNYSNCEDCYVAPTVDGWLEGGGGQTFFKGGVNCRGSKMNTAEVTGGLQTTFDRYCTLGVAASYAHDHLQHRLSGEGDQCTSLGGIYGLYRPHQWYILGNLGFGLARDRVKRHITVGDLQYTNTSKPKIYQGFGYAEIGLDFCSPKWLIQPFGGVEVSSLYHKNVYERGSGPVNLTIRKKARTNCCTRLGFHITGRNRGCISLSLDAAWQYRLSKTDNDVTEQYTNFGNVFKIYGNPLGRNCFDGAVTLTTYLKNEWQLYVEVTGQRWSGRAITYSAIAGAKHSW